MQANVHIKHVSLKVNAGFLSKPLQLSKFWAKKHAFVVHHPHNPPPPPASPLGPSVSQDQVQGHKVVNTEVI